MQILCHLPYKWAKWHRKNSNKRDSSWRRKGRQSFIIFVYQIKSKCRKISREIKSFLMSRYLAQRQWSREKNLSECIYILWWCKSLLSDFYLLTYFYLGCLILWLKTGRKIRKRENFFFTSFMFICLMFTSLLHLVHFYLLFFGLYLEFDKQNST